MADQANLAAVLLARAQDDLTGARSLLDIPLVTDMIVCFHAQQAVEKSLKAALAAHGHDFAFTTTSMVFGRHASLPGWAFQPASMRSTV